ncbi:putative nitrite reductase [NAD(P)H] small subunit, NirD [Tanacetum coccineum]
MATTPATTTKLSAPYIRRTPPPLPPPHTSHYHPHATPITLTLAQAKKVHHAAANVVACKAAEVTSGVVTAEDGRNWVPVVPLSALPRGERRVIIQDGEEILLLWYKDQVFAIENRSPAEGAYSEGLINAKLTQHYAAIVHDCPGIHPGSVTVPEYLPHTPLQTGVLRSGFPKEIPVLSGRALTSGITASDVNVDEVRMVIDEGSGGFGFTKKNELINGKAAIIGFLLLLDFELLTGRGILKGTGFLDFLYAATNAFN